MNWIRERVFGYIRKRLDGYKTKIGGVSAILLGIIGMINIIWPHTVPVVPAMGFNESWLSISGGFVALGWGGKMDKNTAAVEASNGATQVVETQIITTPELTEEQRATLNNP